jgi:hypothetical protein
MAAALASAPACANAGLILGHFTETGVTSLGTDIHTMKDADALLAGAIPGTTPSTAMIPLVNLKDPDNPGGHFHFHHKSPFITDRPGDDRDFAIQITGAIHIPAAGQYTFGVNSDDGFRLQVGSNLSEHVEQRPPKDTLAVFTFDHAADYPLSLTYFEHKGHAELELFASPGRVMSFNDPGADFELIGDAPHGGLELVPDVGAPVRLVGSGVPEAAPAWAAIALAPLLSRRLRRPL